MVYLLFNKSPTPPDCSASRLIGLILTQFGRLSIDNFKYGIQTKRARSILVCRLLTLLLNKVNNNVLYAIKNERSLITLLKHP